MYGCVFIKGFTTIKGVLHLPHSVLSNSNELQGSRPTRILVIILQYSDTCAELQLTFSNVNIFWF